MSDHYDKIIQDAEAKLTELEQSAIDTKKFINQVLAFAGRLPRFASEELGLSSTKVVREISRNEFYGRPFAWCVRELLERRKSTGSVKEATLDEILSALEQGGFDLKKISQDKGGQKRGVAISLAKNTKTFHKLPNGDFGLSEWYDSGSLRKERRSNKAPNENEDADFEDAEELSDEEAPLDPTSEADEQDDESDLLLS